MRENNGKIVFTQLETKDNVVHAGPLELLELFQTDFALQVEEKLM